jgi:hypothetical protein
MKYFLFLAGCLINVPAGAQPPRYGVVITEIFADPSPSAGLPAGEFLELRNNLSFPVILDRWRVTDGQSTAQLPAGTVLLPDSFLVLCPRAYQAAYAARGKTVGLSGFPSLDNGGDLLMLYTAEGRLMHAVSYDDGWYGNTLKADGGWSLEMIDTRFPCMDRKNWTASMDPSGGSPGQTNSAHGEARDSDPPQFTRTYAKDSLTLVAVFDETLDSLIATNPDRYELGPGPVRPLAARPQAPLFREVELLLPVPMEPKKNYLLNISGLKDCRGNTMVWAQENKAALASDPGADGICINEILFDPVPGGSDYVELFNKGDAAIDVAQLYLGNRNAAGQPASLVPCAHAPWILFPGEYLALTENPAHVLERYTVASPGKLLQVKAMPSLPDDEGTILVTGRQGAVLDAFHYTDNLHFPLLTGREGVSLERISPLAPAHDPANWHSAASGTRYGTPTGRNSQYLEPGQAGGEVEISPRIFSPDLDGRDDQLTVRYRFPGPGYVCSVIIFDGAGMPVRYLARNHLCATSGLFRWNGLDEQNARLPMGLYYVLVEFFNLEGRRKQARQAVALVLGN